MDTHFMLNMFRRISELRTRLRRTYSAVEYILINNLNTIASSTEGALSHRQLKDVFFDLLPRVSPTIFCDIGAHDAAIARDVKTLLPHCVVHAFEANPEVYAAFAGSESSSEVDYRHIAITDRVGEVTVFAPRTLSRAYIDGQVVDAHITEPSATGKTSLLKRNESAKYQDFTVPGTTLDAFFGNAGTVAGERFALWIDAEGAADKVLNGASSVLQQTTLIFIEAENFEFWKDQMASGSIARMLILHGFIPIARDREYGDKQFNMLFLRAEIAEVIYPDLFDAQSKLRRCTTIEPSRNELMQSSGSQDAVPKPDTKNTIRHSSLASRLQSKIPIIIPSFNNPTYLRNMILQLQKLHFDNIMIVDNGSTFPPMREYLLQAESEVEVIRLTDNKGPRDIFLAPENIALLPDYFCVTDPDLEFNTALPGDFVARLASLTEKHQVGKAGLSLCIADAQDMRETNFRIGDRDWKIWEWEAQFWREKIDELDGKHPVYKASLDTTFAVYNKTYFRAETFLEAIRVAGDYTCRHLPWYKDMRIPDDEARYYARAERFSSYLKGSMPSD
jgi:FkbM family methyltransferase